MTTSRMQHIVKAYRAQLDAHDARALHVLEHAYHATLLKIQPRLDALYRQIEERQREGEDLPLSWLYEEHRLQHLKAFIEEQMQAFSGIARLTTANAQHQAVSLAQQSAMAQLEATLPTGVRWQFGRPSPDAIVNLVGATQQGSPLYDLFDSFGPQAAASAGQALITGVTLGQGPREIAQAIEDALDTTRARALTIARTEAIRAYRGAQIENFRANSDVVGQWRWTCDKSARTCAACIAMDGQLFDLDQDMESHPNCRCVMTPVTKSWSDILGDLGIDTSDLEETSPIDDMQSGADWFDEQGADVQRGILGNAKYDAWSNGDFTLSDIVGRSDDPTWGGSIYEKSLKELRA